MQLNVVRTIATILLVVQADMNGDVPADSEDDQPRQNDEEPIRFTDRHQRLIIRLAPLLGVERELKQRLGSGFQPLQSAGPMVATPFEGEDETQNTKRKLSEFTVRSWKDVLDPGLGHLKAVTGSKHDNATVTIAQCKDDMKALWEDSSVKLALKRRKLQLPDSAGLYVGKVCSSNLSLP